MTGPPPSGIRRFYGKIESVGDRNEKYLCGLCSTVVSSSVAATSNLIKHMRRHHPKEFEEYQREQGRTDLQIPSHSSVPQQRPSGSTNVERRIRIMEESHEANVRRLVCFLAGTFLPPSIVDTPSFTQFVKGLEPRFTIPSSHQLNMVVLPQTYDDLREKLKETLSWTQGVCLTIDIMKDHYENYFLIILVSYITTDWKKRLALLTCKLFKTQPSNPLIQATYESTVREMNIENKIQSIVIGKMRKPKRPNSGFIGWESGTESTKTEDDYFTPYDAFDELWEELPGAQRCFNDVLHEVVGRGIAEASIFSEQIQKVFEAFEDASDRLQNTKGIASSQVLPIVRGLRHHLRSLKPSHLGNVVKALSEALEEKLSSFESNEVLQRASMVDPRFKTAWCSTEERATLQSRLQMSVVQISLKEPDATGLWHQRPEDTLKRPKLFSFMTSERPSPKQWMSSDINECAREEVSRFLASPCREHDVNPLDFWSGMETEFPLIASVARRSLCTEVSTGSLENIFGEDASFSRVIHLTEDEFEKLTFIKVNMEKM